MPTNATCATKTNWRFVMKFKVSCILFAVIGCLFFSSCEVPTDNPTTPATVVTSTEDVATTIYEKPLWYESYTHEGFIYYSMSDKTIGRASSDNPDEIAVIITQAQMEDVLSDIIMESIRCFEVYEDLLIFRNATDSRMTYNLKTGELIHLMNNVGGVVIWRDMIYYTPWRDYTLYRKPLNQLDAEPEFLLENAHTFYVEDNRFFFTHNDEYWNVRELWEFKENGKHRRVG